MSKNKKVTCPSCGSEDIQFAEKVIQYWSLCVCGSKPGEYTLELVDVDDSYSLNNEGGVIVCNDCEAEFGWSEIEDHLNEQE